MNSRFPQYFFSFLGIGILLCGFGFYLYILFNYQYSFNFEVNNPSDFYPFLPFTILVFIIYLFIQLVKPRSQVIIDFANLSLVSASILILIFILIQRGVMVSNEQLHILVAVFLLTLVVSQSLNNKKIIALWIGIIVLFIIELAIGVYQCSKTNFSAPLLITGTFSNSGVYSCYIVIHTPIANYFFRQFLKKQVERRRLIWAVAIIIQLLIITVIVTAKARTSILVLLLLFGFNFRTEVLVFYNKFSRRIAKRIKIVCLGVIILGLAISSIRFIEIKKGSVFGRFLKLEIASRHIDDNLFLGTGYGKFTWYYPQWQAEYFKTIVPRKEEYFLSSGESYILFNEYFQLFEEIGLIGFVIFCFSIWTYFRIKARDSIVQTCKMVVLAILLHGMTSYPFHMVPVMFLLFIHFFFPFTSGFQVFKLTMPSFLNKTISSIAIILAGLGFINVFGIWNSTRQWHELQTAADVTLEAKNERYSKLYQVLKYDGKFLFDYGEFLSQNMMTLSQAIVLFEESKKILITYRIVETTAKGYELNRNYERAFENYQFLSWYLPNRVRPKYEMIRMCVLMQNFEKARLIAREVASMAIKIPSPEIDMMKQEIKFLIEAN